MTSRFYEALTGAEFLPRPNQPGATCRLCGIDCSQGRQVLAFQFNEDIGAQQQATAAAAAASAAAQEAGDETSGADAGADAAAAGVGVGDEGSDSDSSDSDSSDSSDSVPHTAVIQGPRRTFLCLECGWFLAEEMAGISFDEDSSSTSGGGEAGQLRLHLRPRKRFIFDLSLNENNEVCTQVLEMHVRRHHGVVQHNDDGNEHDDGTGGAIEQPASNAAEDGIGEDLIFLVDHDESVSDDSLQQNHDDDDHTDDADQDADQDGHEHEEEESDANDNDNDNEDADAETETDADTDSDNDDAAEDLPLPSDDVKLQILENGLWYFPAVLHYASQYDDLEDLLALRIVCDWCKKDAEACLGLHGDRVDMCIACATAMDPDFRGPAAGSLTGDLSTDEEGDGEAESAVGAANPNGDVNGDANASDSAESDW